MTKHSLTCEAPICVDDFHIDLIWYAGEPVCSKVSQYTWQAMQRRINKYLQKGNKVSYRDEPLNTRLLESRSF